MTADASRATIRTVGALTRPASAVLISVLQAHLVAGRHFLHVDLGRSTVAEPALAALAAARRRVAEGGATVVFENAPPGLVGPIHDSTLPTRAAR